MATTDEGGGGSESRRYLTFRIEDRLYAASADSVAEVIEVPVRARVPLAPRALLGLANLRGAVLPLVSLRILLGLEPREEAALARAVIWTADAPVGLVVDGVEALVTAGSDETRIAAAELSAQANEMLLGAFALAGGGGTAKILDVSALLARAFTGRARAARQAPARSGLVAEGHQPARRHETLLTFEINNQEFAIDIGAVREILALPETIAAAPRADAATMGMINLREHLLPLLSLRALLGFPPAPIGGPRQGVVVVSVKGALVGLIADRARAVVSVDPSLIDLNPPIFAARAGGETQIKSVYRAEGGKRLVSIIAIDQLFREDVMSRLGDTRDANATTDVAIETQTRQFLIFRLGDDEFALPIEAVDEVARVPGKITRVPKTPEFLEGVINLRGQSLPVVDQRRRFDMPARARDETSRLIVVRTERHRAGLIVDSVSRVLGAEPDAIQAAPDLTGDITRMVRGVLSLAPDGRIVIVLDPVELLTRAESGLLDALAEPARTIA